MPRTLPLVVAVAAALGLAAGPALAAPPGGCGGTVTGKRCALPTRPGGPMAAAHLARPAAASLTADAAPAACDEAPGAVCGSLEVPLERSRPNLGTIAIGYELHPHTDTSRPALGTLVVNPGGPGAATRAARDVWNAAFGPVLDRYDLLLIDDRGRGSSGAIDCPDLQHGVGDVLTAIGSCGTQLGATAGAYGTAAVADDIDAVRAALGIDKITYYGVSYGGVDLEAYATRHGEHLAAAVADAPWTSLADAAQIFEVPSLVRGVTLSCGRALGCAARNGSGRRLLAWLTDRLASAPLTGTGIDFAGKPFPVRLDEATLITWVLQNASGFFGPPGEVPAAVRALRRGDDRPMLRLAAEWLGVAQGASDAGDPALFSQGSYAATWCADSQELYDTTAPPAVRAAQYAAAFAAFPEHRFAPFHKDAWKTFLRAFGGGDFCVPWPAPRRDVVAAGARYPAVPVLVLTGDVDAIVPSEYVVGYAARWPRHTFVRVAGAGHGTLFWGSCARTIILRFLRTYRAGDTSCARTPLPAFATPEFPRTVADATPAAGAGATARGRRAAAVAALTVLDAFKRAAEIGPLEDAGLRGGRFSAVFGPTAVTVSLDGDRFAQDLAVTGIAAWRQDRQISGTVDLVGAVSGRLRLSGSLLVTTNDRLTLTGTVDGRDVTLTTPST